MKDTIRLRLEKMTDRFEEVGRLLATPEIAGGSQQFRDLSMEYSRLQPLAEAFVAFQGLEADLAAAREMSADPDQGMRALGEEEVTRVQERMAELIQKKIEGQEITVTPEAPAGKVIDLMEALKASLGMSKEAERKPAAAAASAPAAVAEEAPKKKAGKKK